MKKADIHSHYMGEKSALGVGDNAQADETHQHRLGVIGEPLDDKGDQDRAADDPQHAFLFADEDFIDHRLHQPGRQCAGAGDDGHADKRRSDQPAVGMDEIPEQTAHQIDAGTMPGRIFIFWSQGLIPKFNYLKTHSTAKLAAPMAGGPAGLIEPCYYLKR